MPVCVSCRRELDEAAFGVQAVKIDRRPGRRPRVGVRNSRCLACDSRAVRKGEAMATGREIVAAWDAKRALWADNDVAPSGYILSADKDGNEIEMAVWIPPWVRLESMNLPTFRKKSRAA